MCSVCVDGCFAESDSYSGGYCDCHFCLQSAGVLDGLASLGFVVVVAGPMLREIFPGLDWPAGVHVPPMGVFGRQARGRDSAVSERALPEKPALRGLPSSIWPRGGSISQ